MHVPTFHKMKIHISNIQMGISVLFGDNALKRVMLYIQKSVHALQTDSHAWLLLVTFIGNKIDHHIILSN